MSQHPDTDAHVASCAECQTRAMLSGLEVDLNRAWLGVAAKAWARHPSHIERFAGWMLQSPGLARSLVTTPSLVLSWIVATVAVLAVGVVATYSTDDPWVALLAPALAGAGVAYAYGPGVDPACELSQTMAISDRMVLLARLLAVFGVNAALGTVATLLSMPVGGLTLAWLAPMTAVSALGLAAATLGRSANVGVAAALSGWGLVVLTEAYVSGSLASAVERSTLVPAYLLAAVVCLAATLVLTSGGRARGIQWQ